MQRGRSKFRFKHKLLSLDATMIPLCLSVFDWGLYRRSKGAVKLHLVLDHDGYLPQFAVVTDGQSSDIEVARKLQFEPGTVVVIDRGYQDFAWWLELSRNKVFFVTRLKDNAEYGIVEQRTADRERDILLDEVVVLTKIQEERGPDAAHLSVDRRQTGIDGVPHQPSELAAPTIAAIYRERWQVDLFFKALKQCIRLTNPGDQGRRAAQRAGVRMATSGSARQFNPGNTAAR